MHTDNSLGIYGKKVTGKSHGKNSQFWDREKVTEENYRIGFNIFFLSYGLWRLIRLLVEIQNPYLDQEKVNLGRFIFPRNHMLWVVIKTVSMRF